MGMKILNLIIPIYYLWGMICKHVEGNEIDCTVCCACCKDRVCGQGEYFSNECTNGCIDGYAGARCYGKCTNNCRKCDLLHDLDTCTECYGGYFPGPANDCASECLPNCKTCTSGSSCTSCKEEYFNENGSNDCRYRYCPEHCKCKDKQCISCNNGYYDISNSCNSACLGNCVTCLSKTYCDICSDGYYNGYQSDDSGQPLLNTCTNKCRDNCRQCSSYNTCSKCQPGFYGAICETKCSPGCITDICDIQSGECECSPNFDGEKCDRCQPGKYGALCDQRCFAGCKGLCDKDSGNCMDGCIVETIVGDKCDVCSPASCPPVKSNSMALIAIGSSFAVSLVANVLFVIYIVLRVRQRNDQSNQRRELLSYVNNGGVTDMGTWVGPLTFRKPGGWLLRMTYLTSQIGNRINSASINTNIENTREDSYENIETDQVSDANYESIQQDPRSN